MYWALKVVRGRNKAPSRKTPALGDDRGGINTERYCPSLRRNAQGGSEKKDRACNGLGKGVRECWVSLGRYLARYGTDIERGLDARFKASLTGEKPQGLMG